VVDSASEHFQAPELNTIKFSLLLNSQQYTSMDRVGSYCGVSLYWAASYFHFLQQGNILRAALSIRL